jgi:hypothetical protein
MSNDDFDDGLVHGHDWASEAPTPAPVPRLDRRPIQMHATPEERDDGLVHGHAWAMGSEL